MLELVDRAALRAAALNRACGFDSLSGHTEGHIVLPAVRKLAVEESHIGLLTVIPALGTVWLYNLRPQLHTVCPLV